MHSLALVVLGARVSPRFQERNRFARAGEADRKEGPKLVKHLLAGKMGLGTRRSR